MNYMSKEELIKYKEELETEVYKYSPKGIEGPYRLHDLKSQESYGVVTSIYSYLRNVISYLNEENIDYRKIDIGLVIKLFYKAQDITKDNKIIEGASPIDLVEITIGRFEPKLYCSAIDVKDKDKFDYYYNTYITNFNEFKKSIDSCGLQFGYDGLELTEVEDMDGIIEHMNKYHSPYYRIELQLEIEKDKEKVKKI